VYIKLPRTLLDKRNSCAISQVHIPYPIGFYNAEQTEELRTLKVVAEEVEQILRRYAVLIPDVIDTIEHENYIGYRCMVNDERTGVTREILQRLGYVMEESEFAPYGLFWVTLKTRTEKRKKNEF
jgi:hypothetical protein